MSLYFMMGGVAFLAALLTAWLIFTYRAGRNSARVISEQRNTSDAQQSAEAAHRMLEARTNGIRSKSDLLDTLDKGQF